MTKLEKRILSLTLVIVMVLSTMFSVDITVRAQENVNLVESEVGVKTDVLEENLEEVEIVDEIAEPEVSEPEVAEPEVAELEVTEPEVVDVGSEDEIVEGVAVAQDCKHKLYFDYDDNNHWKACLNCDYKTQSEPHTFGKWIVDREPTATDVGTKHRKCTVCNHEQWVDIPKDDACVEDSTGNYLYKVINNNEIFISKYVGSEIDVKIPKQIEGKNVTIIGHNAFSYSSRITGVEIPNTVTEIGEFAFVNCSKLGKVTFEKGSRLGEIGREAFAHTNIQSIVLPDSVKKIGEGCFYCTENLKTIHIGSGLTVIPDSAFSYAGVENINIPNGVVTIGAYAFASTKLKSVIIPDSVTVMGNYVFKDCHFLTNIELSSNMTYIPEGAFRGSGLKNIKIGNDIKEIGKVAFANCFELESIEIPDSVTRIEYRAFIDCKKLATIKFPTNLERLGGCALVGTTWYDKQKDNSEVYVGNILYSFKGVVPAPGKVKIKDNTVAISEYAFVRQDNLTELIIPDTVEEIGRIATYDCNNLKKVRIPASVKNIGGRAFGYAGFEYAGWPIYNKIDGFVIDGAPGTAAEKYAKDNGFTFEAEKLPEVNFEDSKGLVAQPYGTNKVLLTWKKSANADGYIICGKTASGKYHQIGNTKNLRYVHTKASPEEYNFYWVFPYKKHENGVMVTSKCTKYVYAKGRCAAVKNLKPSSRKNGVKLTWDKVQNADGYLIYGMENGGKYHYIGMTKNQSDKVSYLDTKAVKSVYNFYWVYAYEKDENGKMVVGETAKYVYGSVLK